jgi:energy-converting hydrogenase Eha subunit B
MWVRVAPRLLGARGVLGQRLCGQPGLHGKTVAMTAAEIVVLVMVLVPLVLVGGLFVWAARKDGEEDRAVQARLGIRRRTRLGR